VNNVVRLGGRHCCACSLVCHHIGPALFCARHDPRPVQIVIPVTTAPAWPYNSWSVSW
jgi:hypothetical protein